MVSLGALWLPIVLSAVLVFVVSLAVGLYITVFDFVFFQAVNALNQFTQGA